jgi:N-methylhydantoinase B
VPARLIPAYSGGLAAARVAFKNAHLSRKLGQRRLLPRTGCDPARRQILNARHPAALGLYSIRAADCHRHHPESARARLPEKIPAAHKGDMGGCSISGFRPDGQRFLLMNIFGGGWGGRPLEDGESASVSICQGDVRNTPVELQEIQYPFMIEKFALRQDSGGAGQHRGGLGVELTYRALQSASANVNCERTKDAPWGLNGGKSGAVNEALLIRADGSEQKLLKATGVPLEKDDRLIFRTAGGGGWGDPKKRDKREIAEDVRIGFVSPEAAKRDYA